MSASAGAAGGLQAVLFDLDGTLVDTAPDLAGAVNALRAELGRAALPLEHIRPHVSNGGSALTRLALGLNPLPGACPQGSGVPDAAAFDAHRTRLLQHYRGGLARQSRPFPGMPALLRRLEALGLPWGVVTNKPAWLTEPLLKALGLAARAGCVVSGDGPAGRKPEPGPLLHAARLMGVDPGSCVYVGDAARDIEAATRAGMPALVATFGYIEPGARPETWGAAALCPSPAGLQAFIEAEHSRRRCA